jgi:alkylation response protein AidB-like acyl-CoA dehydrogenase
MSGDDGGPDPLPEPTADQRAAHAFGLSVPLEREAFRATWGRAAAFGLFDLLIPRGRLDAGRAAAVLEGLGEGCPSFGFPLALGAHCFGVGAPLALLGGDTHAALLSDLREGRVIAAFAATEPEAGSDLLSLSTRCHEEGDSYVLQGGKCYITNAEDADVFLVLASSNPRQRFLGISAFLVPRDTAGVRVEPDPPRLGLAGCSVGAVSFDAARLPKSTLLGPLGGGAAVLKQAMLWERGLIVAAQVGVLRRQLRESLDYARGRRQFGRPIGSFQHVAGRIVDLFARYTTSRLLVRETAEKLAAGTLTGGEASLAKLWVSEAELAASLDAFRLRGAAAFIGDSRSSADLRDALGGTIYSGTSDLQKVVIAAELGLVE